MTAGRRLVVIANALSLLVGVSFAVRAGSTSLLGPARSDDLPYGDLLTLSRNGALVWIVLSAVGVVAGITDRLRLALAGGAAWAVLSLVAFVVVAVEADLLGLARPGGSAAALALALVTGIGLLRPAGDAV